MTEAEWLACADPFAMRSHLRDSPSDRKRLLFVVASWRDAWNLIPDPKARQAVHLLEQYAETIAVSDTEFILQQCEIEQGLGDRVWHPDYGDFQSQPPWDEATAAIAATIMVTGAMTQTANDAGRIEEEAERAVVYAESLGVLQAWRSQTTRHAALLRDMFGNPFHPVTPTPRARTSTVVAIAQAMYDNRRFQDLPILADALEDAGCDNADILNHCRSGGEHVRGCWAVDLVLGKE